MELNSFDTNLYKSQPQQKSCNREKSVSVVTQQNAIVMLWLSLEKLVWPSRFRLDKTVSFRIILVTYLRWVIVGQFNMARWACLSISEIARLVVCSHGQRKDKQWPGDSVWDVLEQIWSEWVQLSTCRFCCGYQITRDTFKSPAAS